MRSSRFSHSFLSAAIRCLSAWKAIRNALGDHGPIVSLNRRTAPIPRHAAALRVDDGVQGASAHRDPRGVFFHNPDDHVCVAAARVSSLQMVMIGRIQLVLDDHRAVGSGVASQQIQ